jgi:hypothetical protein
LLRASIINSVLDPDTPDPHAFGPPGSGSSTQRYASAYPHPNPQKCHGSGTLIKSGVELSIHISKSKIHLVRQFL